MSRSKSNHQQAVEQFMVKAGQEVPSKPTIPSEAVRILRAKLIFEEALETIEALGVGIAFSDGQQEITALDGWSKAAIFNILNTPNLEQIVDGCCDIMVVTTGTLSACGIADVGPQKLVDDSNLAKFGNPLCVECQAEMEFYHSAVGDYWKCSANPTHKTIPKESGSYRREDGKWIKPPWWKVPNLGGEIVEQIKEVERMAKTPRQQQEGTLPTEGKIGQQSLKAADEYFDQKNEEAQHKCPDCGEPMRYVKIPPVAEEWWCPNHVGSMYDPKLGRAPHTVNGDYFNPPAEGKIKPVSLTTGQAAEPREYPSYNPSAYKVNVAGACADILLDGHPGWWASIDEPRGLTAGMEVEFINSMSGKTLIRGKVSELVPPGIGDSNYRWEGKDFKDWWIIVYEVEDKRQDESDILKRMGTDSRKWAEEFKQTRLVNPAIPSDDATMSGWFEQAILAGGNAVRELYKETPFPPKWENGPTWDMVKKLNEELAEAKKINDRLKTMANLIQVMFGHPANSDEVKKSLKELHDGICVILKQTKPEPIIFDDVFNSTGPIKLYPGDSVTLRPTHAPKDLIDKNRAMVKQGGSVDTAFMQLSLTNPSQQLLVDDFGPEEVVKMAIAVNFYHSEPTSFKTQAVSKTLLVWLCNLIQKENYSALLKGWEWDGLGCWSDLFSSGALEKEKKPEPLPVKQAAAIMQGVAAEDVIYRYMRDSLAEGITSFPFPSLCSLIGDIDATRRALDSLWREGKIRISGVDAWELVE